MCFLLNHSDFPSFTRISSSCVSSPEDRGGGFGSRPAVLWPQHSRHDGHEQRRLGGPGRGFSRRCRSAVVGIERRLDGEKENSTAAVSRREGQSSIHLLVCDASSPPSQVSQRRAHLRQREVRAQQDQHLREGLPARRQRRDLHVGHRVLQHHRQDAHFSRAGSR